MNSAQQIKITNVVKVIKLIEFKTKYIHKLWYPNKIQWWQKISSITELSEINFSSIEVRINSVVYKQNTPAYRKAFEQERMIERLKQ